MRVSCIGDYNSVLLACKLGRIVVLPKLGDLLFFHLHVLLSLADRHFHTTILNNVVRAQILLLFYALGFLSCFFLLGSLSRLVLLSLIQTFLKRVERVLNNLGLVLCLLGQLVRCLSHHDVWQTVFRLIFLVFLLSEQLSSE